MTYSELVTAMEATGKLIPHLDYCEAERCDVEKFASPIPWKHLRWMVQEALSWGPERAEKLNRWLGFVQGVLWANQVATIEQLRQVNLGAKEMDGAHREPACTCTGIGDDCSMPCPVAGHSRNDPECTCYEHLGGHQPGCPRGQRGD